MKHSAVGLLVIFAAVAFAHPTSMITPLGGDIPAPEALNQRIFNGQTAGDQFGTSVAGAGDVNGDGFDDLIVGAWLYGANDAGRAYIYFGGTTINSSPDVVLSGASAGEQLGWSVAGAGDVNGDGFADVIVGAPQGGPVPSGAGKAYIFYGGGSMNSVADVTITGGTTGDQLGASVASAGDVNGDGFADVIVGAFGQDAGGTDAGRAYVYYGGASMNNGADVTFTGQAAADYFGYSVAGAGDVNGDGFADVLVGAYGNNTGGADAGRAYLYYGGSAMNNTADVTYTGAAAGDFLGGSVASAGDTDGDGYADVLIGANGNDAAGVDAGRAYLFRGGPVPDNTADVTFTGVGAGGNFGGSVTCIGDRDGDGYPDIAIGARTNSAAGLFAGRAYVFHGGPAMDSTPDTQTSGEAAGDFFGYSVAGAGDINGDGSPDLLFGAPLSDGTAPDAGRAYLLIPSMQGSDVPAELFTGAAPGDNFGSLGGAGDVNGDGYPDICVGATGSDAGGNNSGAAYIYFGGPTTDNVPDVTLLGETAGDNFGGAVASAGDVNGDGFDDVIVGATGNSAGGYLKGRAYIYLGGPSMDNVPDIVLTPNTDFFFGRHVACAGDINGDGYDDLLVGGLANNLWISGSWYLYFGGPTMDNSPDLSAFGSFGDNMGSGLAGAGDVNGDGFDDFLIGTQGANGASNGRGRVEVFFGGPQPDNLADVTLPGVAPAQWLGSSVAGGGDLNGDGFADIVAGAPKDDTNGQDAGMVYVYFGGALIDSIPDVQLPGPMAGAGFGNVLASAGDINNDGYDDLMLGLPYADLRGTDAGVAYIFFGGSTLRTQPDMTLYGAQPGDLFGGVAGAGDMNRDGYDDFLIGAGGNDAGGTDAGRAYLFFGSGPNVRPQLRSVADVPSDQGGRVTLRWARSGYDQQNGGIVTGYVVERSLPPGTTGLAWEEIGAVTARNNPQYSFTASTLYDSTTNSSGAFFFRITAVTAYPSEYWRSNIMSGHSVDNLAPGSIPSLIAQQLPGPSVRLTWPRNNGDADLRDYVVYRGTSSNFPLNDSTRLGSTPDSTFTDGAPPAGNIFYRVTARDIHFNEGGPSPEAAVGSQTTQQIAVAGGWNIVSVPLTVSDYAKTALFPTSTSNAFAYQGGYVAEPVLTNGKGYWLKFGANQSVLVLGFPRSFENIPVLQGWNLIGSVSEAVGVTNVQSVPPGLVTTSFFGYASGGYAVADSIRPGMGYWVKVSGNGTLVLTGALTAPESRITILPTAELPPPPPGVEAAAAAEVPAEFALEQNYPNPFNPETAIRFQITDYGFVSLRVYDLLGRQVATLVDEYRAPGSYTVTFPARGGSASGGDASNLSSGTYIYRLTAGGYTATRRMMLVK